jgi:hypothetical protein
MMKKLKSARREKFKELSIDHNAVRIAKFWILAPDFCLLSRKNFFRKTKPNFARHY